VTIRYPLPLLMRRLVPIALVLALGAIPAAGSGPSALTPAERAAVAHVRLETLREVTAKLAAPEMEGRATATPGGDRAARYIADRFAKVGLEPLGDAGGYLQAINFRSHRLMPDSSVSTGSSRLAPGADFIFPTTPQADRLDASGGLVFLAYGVASPELGRDDFAGLDLKGKVVVLLTGKPDTVDEAAWKKSSNQQASMVRIFQSAPAAVVIAGVGTPQMSFETISDYLSRRRVALADAPSQPAPPMPILLAGDAGLEKLFAGTGTTWAKLRETAAKGEKAARDFGGKVDVALRFERATGVGHNVAGVLRGSDPKLKDEAIVYTAHYDAYGKTDDGQVYHGAADNAMGVGMIVAMAEAFAKLPERPRRSIVFLAVTGEEYGLLGAKHWTEHPTWPIDKVVANLNFDGMGTEVYGPVKGIIGFGAEHSDIGEVFKGVVAATGLEVAADPLPEENLFTRSDHFTFVQKGVPAMSFMGVPAGDAWVERVKTWLKTDYHQPEDNITPAWDWTGPHTLASTGFLIGMRVAAADAAPAWLPSSPYQRKAAAAAAG
jgi:Zn-dependent M28 family amino/carboxypeptidase